MIRISGRGRYKDLKGEQFGRLTVIERATKPSHIRNNCNETFWMCLCECGNTKVVIASKLNNGNTRSCGCLQKESRHYHNKKYNTYETNRDYRIGYTEEKKVFYFDLEDYDLIKEYYWSLDKDNYIINILTGIRMHRLVMNCPKEMQIDHINHNKNDNRKCNLRIVNNQQNQRNKNIYKCNKTGVSGVRTTRDGKFASYVTIDKKYIHLGTYKNKEDAITARQEAVNIYYGEYDYDSSQRISDTIEI